MERLKIQYKNLLSALDTLELAIHLFDQASENHLIIQLRSPNPNTTALINNDNIVRSFRDSLIQRFEYCVDTLWKYLKDYLENIQGILLEIKSPRSVIRATGNARFMSEEDVELAMTMIDSRNRTSHIYKEEIAQEIAEKIHNYYKLMRKVVDKIKP